LAVRGCEDSESPSFVVLIVIGKLFFGFGFLPYFSALITNLHLDFVVATFTCVTVGVTTKGTYT